MASTSFGFEGTPEETRVLKLFIAVLNLRTKITLARMRKDMETKHYDQYGVAIEKLREAAKALHKIVPDANWPEGK